MSRQLLERCLDAAVSRGIDVTAEYKPWLPVDVMQTLLVNVHDSLGCSWFTAIVVACLGIRVVTLPISVAAIRGAREKALIQPKFQELTEKQKTLSMEGDQSKAQEVSKEIQAFSNKHGKLFMLKGTWNLILFQVPLYITAFAAMRGFANYPDVFRGFAMESPLWLDSLALADPYALMPLLTASIMITNTELFGSIDTEAAQMNPLGQASETQSVGGQNTFQKYQKWIMRGSAIMFIPMTWNFPAGVFVFMSTNLISSTVQNRLLRLPVLERLLEIPPPPERAAAAAAAAAIGAPALVPLGHTLKHAGFGSKLGTSDGRPHAKLPAPALRQRPNQQAIAASGAPGVGIGAATSRSLPVHPSMTKSTVEGLQVSQRFAVKRARPAGAAELAA